MRNWLSVGVLAAALVAGGCGAGNDVAQINKVVGDYGRALAAGDGDRACAMLTPRARAHLVRANPMLGLRECRLVVRIVPAMFTDDQLRELRHLRLEDAKITGDRAVGRHAGLHALERTGDPRLRRIDGRWLIDGANPERP